MKPADLEARLRRALHNTSEEPPRPISPIELPLNIDKLITPRLLNSLRPAAVLVPVIRRARELTVLFTLRAETLRAHKGQISFPGGRRDEEDTSAAANALREAQEETGLDPKLVEVVGYLDDYPTITRYRVTPVVGMVDGSASFTYDESEVAEVFEVPLSFLLKVENFERKAFTRSGVNVPFFELNYQRWRIWGATAGMLWNLAQKVGQVK
ncbi:MAG TPA: CoA pyrophosphatase [Nevskiaceae bacterium]|nr:CoA pyrophosphatase [Nevskiaceae bacterium]